VRPLLLVLVGALALPGGAVAADPPTRADLEDELVCPTCETTLEMSSSPVAERMRAFIDERIAAGDSKEEIKAQLVEQFGEGVLAAPPRRGFNLLAWALPLAGLAAAAVAVSLAARRRLRTRANTPAAVAATNHGPSLDPDLERRLDDELARFDA
jgi:cytochrome c-type biogenesis protein CcmH